MRALALREFIVDLLKGLGMGQAILLAKTVIAAIISDQLIDFIEETFFRGELLSGVRKEGELGTTFNTHQPLLRSDAFH